MCKILRFVSRFMCDATVVDLIANAVLTYGSDISAGNSTRVCPNKLCITVRTRDRERKKT